MKNIRLCTLCAALFVLLGGIGCDLFLFDNGKPGELITPAATPTLVLYNVSGNKAAAAESIGNVPEMLSFEPTAAPGRAMLAQAELLKDHPGLRGLNGIQQSPLPLRTTAKAAAAPRAPITDATTTHRFYAVSADSYLVQIDATKRAAGTYCYVFVEDGEEGAHNWQSIANFFDAQVWPKNTALFGEPHIVRPDSSHNKGSEKIVIFYHKIRDSETKKEEPRILGYFWNPDLRTDLPSGNIKHDSNGMNIFYMNLAFGPPDHSEMKRTLFHEFQHMINYSGRVIVRGQPEMDLWMDEGLAESAEHYGLNTHGSERIAAMNQDRDGRLANGISLVAWPTDADSIIYGLVYTFMQYLRLQLNNWGFMTTLINHNLGDYRALEAAMSGNTQLNTFEKMVKNYHLARFLNETDGLHSFKSERKNFKFTPRAPGAAPNATTKIGPGGAIFIPTTSEDLSAYTRSGAGANIRDHKHFP